MSMSQNFSGAHLSLTDPRSVAIYDTYEDAQKAVDYLADHKFPVEKLMIVGTDLKSMERVTGTLSWGKVLIAGALSGVMWGLMLAVLLWILIPGYSVVMMVTWGLLMGVIYGALSQAIQYGMTRGKRDFASQTAVVATHYEVLGEADSFQEARALLGEKPLAWRPQTGNTGVLPVVQQVAPDESASVDASQRATFGPSTPTVPETQSSPSMSVAPAAPAGPSMQFAPALSPMAAAAAASPTEGALQEIVNSHVWGTAVPNAVPEPAPAPVPEPSPMDGALQQIVNSDAWTLPAPAEVASGDVASEPIAPPVTWHSHRAVDEQRSDDDTDPGPGAAARRSNTIARPEMGSLLDDD